MKKTSKILVAALISFAAGFICISCNNPAGPNSGSASKSLTINLKGVLADTKTYTLTTDELESTFPSANFKYYTDFEKKTEWDGKTSVDSITAALNTDPDEECEYSVYYDDVLIYTEDDVYFVSYLEDYLYTDKDFKNKWTSSSTEKQLYYDVESSYKDEEINWAFEICVKANWKYVHAEYDSEFTTIIFTCTPDFDSIGDALKDYSYPRIHDVYVDKDGKTKLDDYTGDADKLKEFWILHANRFLLCQGDEKDADPPQGASIDEDDLDYKYHQYFFITHNDDGTMDRVYWDGKPTEGLLHNVWCGCWKTYDKPSEGVKAVMTMLKDQGITKVSTNDNKSSITFNYDACTATVTTGTDSVTLKFGDAYFRYDINLTYSTDGEIINADWLELEFDDETGKITGVYYDCTDYLLPNG